MAKGPVTTIRPTHQDSHQTSSGFVICFLPFTYRDTYYKDAEKVAKPEQALQINKPLVVVNDALTIQITNSKANAMDQANVVLSSTDVNYGAAIANGDHALIWLQNNQEDWYKVSNDVLNKRANLNYEMSGLKFIGKVNSIRQMLSTAPDGKKQFRYNITLVGFSEFQTQVYFNELLNPDTADSKAAPVAGVEFFVRISEQYQDLFKSFKNDNRLPTEVLMSFFVDVFMGPGPKDGAKVVDSKLTQTPNAAFLVPTELAKYLGLKVGAKADKSLGFQYSDILHRIFGLQNYTNSMFPSSESGGRKNYFKCGPLKGGTLIPPANFNNTNFWSLLTQFMNPTMNELYTTLKYVPANEKMGNPAGIFPTLVLRQIPFNTKNVVQKYNASQATQFSNLPRWKISSDYPIVNYNLGTTDAERFNFFQVFTNSIADNDQQRAMQVQIVSGNVRIDQADIIRSGPRIHMSTSDTEASIQNDGSVQPSAINEWAELIADWFVNGHLKMNGSLTVAGIQEPISVGDNLEFDGKVLHIEGIVHQYQVDPVKGGKSFTTTLMLSHGYYVNPATGDLQYMADQATTREYMNDNLLPGFTDEERYVNDTVISSRNDSSNEPSTKSKSPGEFISDELKTRRTQLQEKFKNKKGSE